MNVLAAISTSKLTPITEWTHPSEIQNTRFENTSEYVNEDNPGPLE